jgi:transposase
MAIRKIDLDQLRVLPDFQAREKMSRTTIEEYAELATDGTQFPPLTGIDVGGDVILVDGYHRYHAYKKLGFMDADIDVTEGTRADAYLAAARANAEHGLRRTPGDAVKAAKIAILGLIEQNGKKKRPTTDQVREIAGVGSSSVTKAYEQFEAEGINVGPKDKRGRKKGSTEYDYETEEETEDHEVPTPAVMIVRQAAGVRKELEKVLEHAQSRLTNLDAETLADPAGDAQSTWLSVAELAGQIATLIYNRVAEASSELAGDDDELPEMPEEETSGGEEVPEEPEPQAEAVGEEIPF